MKCKIITTALMCVVLFSAVAFAQAPNWSVNPGAYQYSMALSGVIQFDGVESTDVNDIIGAFVGGECRGVAQPKRFPLTGRYTFGLVSCHACNVV